MDPLSSIGQFLLGFLGRAGLLLAVPVALAVVVGALLVAQRTARAAAARLHGLASAGGVLFDDELLYAPGHTWLKPVDGIFRLGLDDFAQHLLGVASAVGLPEPGQKVHAGQTLATIACGARVVDIPAPVGGEVVRINPEVRAHPELVHRSPYGEGWLVEVRAESREPGKELVKGAAAKRWLEEEAARLGAVLEGQLGVAAADGGEFIPPAAALLDESQWRAVYEAFLKRS